MKNHLLLSTIGLSVAIALSSAPNANAFFGMFGGCGAEPSCGCATDCCEPSCGVADACCDPCGSCCKPKRCGLLDKLRARRAARKCCQPSCCEVSCGVADSCCEPSCGCADACGGGCEPSCGVADACGGCESSCCDPCSKPRCGLFAKLKARRAARKCCQPSCCEASCGVADSCCEPSCGCAG